MLNFIAEHYMLFIYIINFILCFAIVFLERKETATTWAWVLVITFIPIIGFILYMFLGRGISKDKIFDLKAQEKLGLKQEMEEQRRALLSGRLPVPKTDTVDAKQLIYMMTVYDEAPYTLDNEVKLFTDGTDKFQALLDDIDHARHHIHLQYYIYRGDQLGKAVRDHLIQAAKRGVEVKVLIDAWGSTKLKKSFFTDLVLAGGDVKEFFPIFVPYINPRLNYRNHRKIVVIDGEIGYTGGFNVGDEYLGLVKKYGYWRDNHLRIHGEAVYTLQNRFIMDWNSQGNPKISYIEEYFPKIESTDTKDIQIVTSGPDTTHEQIKMVYLKMINIAKKEILIQTPYYIPDDSIHEALKLALLSGVKVRIQIPNKPDHMLVYWATYSFAAELIPFGAIIETYEKGFMHAKTVIIDNEVVSVGSANIDNRSFRLDFEVNAIIFDMEVANEVRDAFYADSMDCNLLTQEVYDQRSFFIRFKESIARLVSPLL